MDQRKTLQAFLDEIRLMRNQVVARQPLSAVQLALLENYVHEITEPVQKAYREGRTKVDPSAFQHADPAELGQFFQKNGEDTGTVQDSLQKSNTKPRMLHLSQSTCWRQYCGLLSRLRWWQYWGWGFICLPI
ncbi:STY4199 family HEPN domain-containing protein [Mangrovibacter sp. SLW1]